MKGELIINGKDAYDTWGVRMGYGFTPILLSPAPLKPFVENKSRLEHGKRVIVKAPKIDEREILLPFTICGATLEEFSSRLNSFYSELYKGKVDINVPSIGDDVYHLIYQGKSATYSHGPSRKIASLSVKFCEPNPENRAK